MAKPLTSLTVDDILKLLADLPKEDFDVHTIDNVGGSTTGLGLDPVKCVRVHLLRRRGMLELKPDDNGFVILFCYCCFGGDPKKGVWAANEIRDAVFALVNHRCTPWP